MILNGKFRGEEVVRIVRFEVSLVIETERLILRPLRLSDTNDLLEYQSHPDIVRYIPWPERTRDQVETALINTIETGKFDLNAESDSIGLVWELKVDQPGKVIGQSNMTLESFTDKRYDIGWVTHQSFQRQGYAFEATKALMQYAFQNFSLHRIIANIDTRVPESANLAEKLGMRLEGTFKDGEFFKGAWCDMWLYAILKSEFSS